MASAGAVDMRLLTGRETAFESPSRFTSFVNARFGACVRKCATAVRTTVTAS